MRYVALKIEPGESYLFSIGSREKPDRAFRERIESSINGAMEHLTGGMFTAQEKGEYGIRWSVQVTHEPGIAMLEGEDPGEILIGGRYLIFGLVESSEEYKLSEEELGEIQAETAEKIAQVRPPGHGKTAVIVLQDCSVNWQRFQNKRPLVW